MADLFHQWGADLAFGPTGDLAVALGAQSGQQRILRRLLTNPGDYIWQIKYGAGLARFVGLPANTQQIGSVIRAQMFKETTVARNPEPLISVSPSPGGLVGEVYVHIRYLDAGSGVTQALGVSVNN